MRKGPINHFDPVAAETIKFLGSVARVSDRSRDDVGDDEISFLGTARWRHETTRGALVLSLVTGRCWWFLTHLRKDSDHSTGRGVWPSGKALGW